MRIKIQPVALFLLLATFSITLFSCGSESSNHYEIPDNEQIQAVGFDFDDTLAYSSPAFDRGFDQAQEPFSPEFWKVVNASDENVSCLKPTVVNILEQHQDAGHQIYVITARQGHGGDAWKQYVSETFSIPKENAYFEPNGKTQRIRELGIDIYYGDSNSDITAAQQAGIKPIRIQRSSESNYQAKYNPGKYDEEIVENTASHDCSL